jgi:NADPH:quinone reductase-like Zn-dependent oxidoreductase
VVRSIGADHVIDYTRDDFVALGQRYDLILAVNGNRSIWDYKRVLSADGSYTMTGGSNRQLMDALLFGRVLSLGRQKLGNVLMKPNQADLLFLKALCDAEKLSPVIDLRFPLSQVADAVRYVEDGRARGKVIITIG